MAAGLITLAKIDIENITQWSRWLERLVRLVEAFRVHVCHRPVQMSYLAGFTSGFFPSSL